MDIYDLLKKDHKELRSLFDDVDIDESKRAHWLQQVKSQLIPHTKAEEEVFYAALKKQPESETQALEAIEEHHVADNILDELDETEFDDPRWKAKAKTLIDVVEHHIEEEEEELFESAEKVLSDEQADEMVADFEEAKKEALDEFVQEHSAGRQSNRTGAQETDRPGSL